MQDTKLFETILNITAPWHIARVELKTDAKRAELWLEHDPTRWPCPECWAELASFDHAEPGRGAISTPASLRRICTRRFPASSVRRTASSKCASRGRNRGVVSRC